MGVAVSVGEAGSVGVDGGIHDGASLGVGSGRGVGGATSTSLNMVAANGMKGVGPWPMAFVAMKTREQLASPTSIPSRMKRPRR